MNKKITKDGHDFAIGDALYYSEKINNLFYIKRIVVSDDMPKDPSECYKIKSNAHFLCIAANALSL